MMSHALLGAARGAAGGEPGGTILCTMYDTDVNLIACLIEYAASGHAHGIW